MNAVNVVNLFPRFKGFNKRRSNKAVYQKRFAPFCAGRAVPEPYLNVRFGAPGIFFSG